MWTTAAITTATQVSAGLVDVQHIQFTANTCSSQLYHNLCLWALWQYITRRSFHFQRALGENTFKRPRSHFVMRIAQKFFQHVKLSCLRSPSRARCQNISFKNLPFASCDCHSRRKKNVDEPSDGTGWLEIPAELYLDQKIYKTEIRD